MTGTPEMFGRVINKYRLTRELGRGGMGVVYEAVHTSLGRRAAVKMLLAEFSRKPDIVARFQNEARAVNIIQHPGIVDISEVGTLPSGEVFIFMEFLEGESLGQRLTREGCVDAATALRLGAQVAAALVAAHHKGIIHRDLKPENVMLLADSLVAGGVRTKLLDFGIAKLAVEYADAAAGGLHTGTGLLMGTPSYMSPEQCRGAGGVTDRSDVYSLGVLLFLTLAGRLPFTGNGPGEIIAMHLLASAPPLPGVPPGVAVLVAQMLAKAPAERPSMAEIVAEMSRLAVALAPQPVVVSPQLEPRPDAPYAPCVSEAPGEVRAQAPSWGVLACIGVAVIMVSGVLLLREVSPTKHEDPEAAAALALASIDANLLENRWPEAVTKAEQLLQRGDVSAAKHDIAKAASPVPPAPALRTARQARPPKTAVAVASAAILGSKTPGSAPSESDKTANAKGNGISEKTFEEAQLAYRNGEFERATKLARIAGGNTESWRLIAASACSLRDLKLVAEAYWHLDDAGKQVMTNACRRCRVIISDGLFKLAD